MELRFYDAAEVAELLKCSLTTVHRLIKSGELEDVAFGRDLVFTRESILALYQNRLVDQRRGQSAQGSTPTNRSEPPPLP